MSDNATKNEGLLKFISIVGFEKFSKRYILEQYEKSDTDERGAFIKSLADSARDSSKHWKILSILGLIEKKIRAPAELKDLARAYWGLGKAETLLPKLEKAAGAVSSAAEMKDLAVAYDHIGKDEECLGLLEKAAGKAEKPADLKDLTRVHLGLWKEEESAGIFLPKLEKAAGEASVPAELKDLAEAYNWLGKKEEGAGILLPKLEKAAGEASVSGELSDLAEAYRGLGKKEEGAGILLPNFERIESANCYSSEFLHKQARKESEQSKQREYYEDALKSWDDDGFSVDSALAMVDIEVSNISFQKADNENKTVEEANNAVKNAIDGKFKEAERIIKMFDAADKAEYENKIKQKREFSESIIKQKEELENKLSNARQEIDREVDRALEVLLKRRTDLEYALNKSAIDELWYETEGFYDEIRQKKNGVKNKVDAKGSNDQDQARDDRRNELKIFEPKISHYLKHWFRSTFFSRKIRRDSLNYVLPTLRVTYLGEWKEFLMKSGKILTEPKNPSNKDFDVVNFKKVSDEVGGMIGKFDDILRNDQERELRESAFRRLMFFLFVETAVIFAFAYAMRENKDMQTLLNILIPATLAQITAMVYHIVTSLFPKEKEASKNDKPASEEPGKDLKKQ